MNTIEEFNTNLANKLIKYDLNSMGLKLFLIISH